MPDSKVDLKNVGSVPLMELDTSTLFVPFGRPVSDYVKGVAGPQNGRRAMLSPGPADFSPALRWTDSIAALLRTTGFGELEREGLIQLPEPADPAVAGFLPFERPQINSSAASSVKSAPSIVPESAPVSIPRISALPLRPRMAFGPPPASKVKPAALAPAAKPAPPTPAAKPVPAVITLPKPAPAAAPKPAAPPKPAAAAAPVQPKPASTVPPAPRSAPTPAIAPKPAVSQPKPAVSTPPRALAPARVPESAVTTLDPPAAIPVKPVPAPQPSAKPPATVAPSSPKPPAPPAPAARPTPAALSVVEPPAARPKPEPAPAPPTLTNEPHLSMGAEAESSSFLERVPLPAKIGLALLLILVGAYFVFGRSSGAQDGQRVVVGEQGWSTEWASDANGSRRGRQITLYRPSTGLTDYQMQFTGQIESKALGWVFRAADTKNYYAMKLETLRPGAMAITHFAVVEGREASNSQRPLTIDARPGATYRVKLDVTGPRFTVYIGGEPVDFWTDNRLKAGAVGFMNERDERGATSSVQFSFPKTGN